MHLTTCTLTRRAHRITHDSQAMHRTLKYDIPGHFLWSQPDPRTLVVQHDETVCWPDVMPGILARTHTTTATTPITGAPIQWAMIASPTKATRIKGRRGKRTPLPPEEWKQWVARKLDGAINIHTIDATRLPTARGRRHTMTVTHRRVMFTGTGTVASQAALAELQHDGVGSGKAYGCGLLIVQEVTV